VVLKITSVLASDRIQERSKDLVKVTVKFIRWGELKMWSPTLNFIQESWGVVKIMGLGG
jgi:hypothetical protein